MRQAVVGVLRSTRTTAARRAPTTNARATATAVARPRPRSFTSITSAASTSTASSKLTTASVTAKPSRVPFGAAAAAPLYRAPRQASTVAASASATDATVGLADIARHVMGRDSTRETRV